MKEDFIRRWIVDRAGNIMRQIQQSTQRAFRNQKGQAYVYSGGRISVDDLAAEKSFFNGPRYKNSLPHTPAAAISASTLTEIAAAAKKAPWHQRGILPRIAKAQYRGANALSKALLGASIPQMGLAAAAIGGAAYAGLSLMGVNVPAAAGTVVGTVVGFHESMENARLRSRSLLDFQQSVQGLTFGLHARRTA